MRSPAHIIPNPRDHLHSKAMKLKNQAWMLFVTSEQLGYCTEIHKIPNDFRVGRKNILIHSTEFTHSQS